MPESTNHDTAIADLESTVFWGVSDINELAVMRPVGVLVAQDTAGRLAQRIAAGAAVLPHPSWWSLEGAFTTGREEATENGKAGVERSDSGRRPRAD